ncbi:ribonuclease P protein component [Candidatus Kaiserbacteria bacterium]|nr:ribonuclease P protein component [Candidatus Kaiserbacteria bacterium]
MPKRYSLSGPEIRSVKPSRRISGMLFSLAIARIPDRTVPGVAFVVSKKVALRANVRNLIKRRLRSAVRTHVGKLLAGSAYIFTARRNASHADYADIASDVQDLIAKI